MIALLWLVPPSDGAERDDLGQNHRLEPRTVLRIDILDPATETIQWIGEAIDPATLLPVAVDATLIDPGGAVVGTFASGSIITPGTVGEHTLEIQGVDLDTDGIDEPLETWVAHVLESGVVVDGRVWSRAWRLDAGGQRVSDALNASVYAVVDGGQAGHEGVVEIVADGLAGNRYTLAASGVGIRDGHGRSRPDDGTWSMALDHPIYLRPPDPALVSYDVLQPTLSNVTVSTRGTCSSVIPGWIDAEVGLDSDVIGIAHLVCDLNGDATFDPTSDLDVHRLWSVASGSSVVAWDGLDNLGSAVPAGSFDCIVELVTGEVHVVGLDYETLFEGMRLFEVDPFEVRTGLPMYFNDAEVQANAVEMPDFQFSLETPGAAGLPSGLYLDVAQPNVNARAWGDFSSTSKGNGAFVDTYTWLAADQASLTIEVLDVATDGDGDGLPDSVETCSYGTDPALADSDGDGLDDFVEATITQSDPLNPDSDSDGLFDGVETPDPLAPVDSDGDGLQDAVDPDDDDDGLSTLDEGDADPDGDGRPSHLDSDSDDDGILDAVEGLVDTDGDGVGDFEDDDDDDDGLPTDQEVDGDSDGDGLLDRLDPDDDDDGIDTVRELGSDSDGDGLVDYLDPDDDDDGVPTLDEVDGDTDGDGLDDRLDDDDDDDGIDTSVEADRDGDGIYDDTDGDMVPDFRDDDDDGDGVPTVDEGEVDSDGDGLVDSLDDDDDDDGVPTIDEAPGDSDGDGLPDRIDPDDDDDDIDTATEGNGDTDGDGVPDHLDADADGDTLLDTDEGIADPDGDGLPAFQDADDDGDGIGTIDELDGAGLADAPDHDLDGTADWLDVDDDDDGIDTILEGGLEVDTDGDTVPDYLDDDSDGDGIRDEDEGAVDTDGDALPDFQDDDDDGDGIPTVEEVGMDHDGDGLADPLDPDDDNDGIDTLVEGGFDVDTDGDTVSDHHDLDSDDDGLPDADEGSEDLDGDSLGNYVDLDADGDGYDDIVEGAVDTDGDGAGDWLDDDDDGDGVRTEDEAEGDSDGDGIEDRLDVDDDDDGIETRTEWEDAATYGEDPDGDGVPSWLDLDADGDEVPDQEEGVDDIDGDGVPNYLDPDGLGVEWFRGSGVSRACATGPGSSGLGAVGGLGLLALVLGLRRRSAQVTGGATRWGIAAALALAWPVVAEAGANGPEVSRSRGKRDGVVVLWPRVVPATSDPEVLGLAGRLQERLYSAASAVVDYRRVDVRPSPERVCPRVGCRAPTVGLFLGHDEGGCVVVGMVSPPGPEASDVVPLVGDVEMVGNKLAFRSAPERTMIVQEFVPCTDVEARFNDQLVIQLIEAYANAPD